MSCGLDPSSMLKAGSAIGFLPRHIDLGTLATLSKGLKNGFDLHSDRSGVILSTIHLIASGDFLQRHQRPMRATHSLAHPGGVRRVTGRGACPAPAGATRRCPSPWPGALREVPPSRARHGCRRVPLGGSGDAAQGRRRLRRGARRWTALSRRGMVEAPGATRGNVGRAGGISVRADLRLA
jgi:hypothetical protein